MSAPERSDGAVFGDLPTHVPNIVVVDPHFEAYKSLAASARLGRLNLHFRGSGAEALKLVRHGRVDAWLVAPELDDMSGYDFLDLLRGRFEESKAAMVEAEPVAGRRREIATRQACEAGADSLLMAPITLRDLEGLLGLVEGEQAAVVPESRKSRAFVTLPVGVGAAVVAIAVLMMG